MKFNLINPINPKYNAVQQVLTNRGIPLQDIDHYLNTTDKDLEALQQILGSNLFSTPNVKLSVYKNRRGRYKGVYLWCKADLGCCRIDPMFATTYDYNIINIDDIKIIVGDDNESAF